MDLPAKPDPRNSADGAEARSTAAILVETENDNHLLIVRLPRHLVTLHNIQKKKEVPSAPFHTKKTHK